MMTMNIAGFLTWLSGGFWTGFSAGAACVVVCGSLLLPVVMSTSAGIVHNARVLMWFCLGRLCVYLALGAVLGGAGGYLQHQAWFAWLLPCAYLAAALMLLRYLAGLPTTQPCTPSSRAVPLHVPLVLGLATGAKLCPPVVAAMAATLGAGSTLHGIGYFFAFFLGTSIYLVPLPLAGCLSRWHWWQRLGRTAGALIGFIYVYLALAALHAQFHPRELAACPVAQGTAEAAPADLLKVFPAATHVTPAADAPHVCIAVSNGAEIGCMVDSRTFNITVPGYAGPTPLLLAVDPQGVVTAIHVLPNRETPRYMARVLNAPWWQRFTGVPLEELLQMLDQPDAVAGATMSCEALRAQLQPAAMAAHAHYHAAHTHAAQSAGQRLQHLLANAASWLPVFVLCTVAVVVSRTPRWQRPWMRWAIWIAAIAVLGFYRANYFSIAQVGLVIRGTRPDCARLAWYLMFAFALLSPLLWGRVYCQYLCPFGVLSEALHRLTPWSLTLPAWLVRRLRYAKFAVLAGALAWLVYAPAPPVERLEPFHAIFIHPQPYAYVIFGATVLLVSLFVKRFWCTLFCLGGALLELIGKYRWGKQP